MLYLDRYLIVSGSFSIELEQAYRRVERYDIARDKWEDLPMMNVGRALHSSVAFNDRFAFVFCGERMPTGGLTTSIERYDVQKETAGWREIRISTTKNDLTRARQVPAIIQLNDKEILIMGGFAISSALKGLFQGEAGGVDGLPDIYVYNIHKKSIVRVDDPEIPAAQAQKIHPWHFATVSMLPHVAITFNYDSNAIIEVQVPLKGQKNRRPETRVVEDFGIHLR